MIQEGVIGRGGYNFFFYRKEEDEIKNMSITVIWWCFVLFLFLFVHKVAGC